MRLRTIEIKGFKSFANETVIHFNSDVTGIVGPNGSGKSNIVDAVRWVLGEQKSSQLRLDKMASVIFNGAKKRKEAQVAQVTLTFDNTKNILPTDYGSVSVSRILYRSGESEYRLNGVACRLKDITSLFLDTGIGPDSYAIIALNMVEDLLSDREQARRKMFEQAAGISKYKARKHETQQKLEVTGADLDRVEDLLFEIEDQLRKLEKQAQRTRKYYEMKDEYRAASVELAVFNLSKHKTTFKTLKEQIVAREDAYRSAEAQGRLIEADLEAKRKSHADKETKLSDSQQQVNQLAGRIRGRENEKSMLSQRLNYLRNDLEKLQTAIQAHAEQLQSLESAIEAYQTELNYETRLEVEAGELLDQRQQALEQAHVRHGALKGDLEQFVQAQQAAERAALELEKQKAVKNAQAENLRRDMQRTLGDITARKAEMDNLLAKLSEREREAGKMQAQLERAETAETDRRAELTRIEAEIEVLRKKSADHRRALDARQNEFKLTKSMVENLEGFPESIRFLSNQKEWAQRCPLLSDLLFVQEAYRVAVENYLEPYLNYYVAPSIADAAAAIQLLHSSQKGRANFFILELIDRNPPELKLLPGSLPAMNVVSADPAYRNLVAFLLGDVVIVEEQSPLPVPTPDVVYLQKNGGFVQRRFSLAGGSVGLFEGKKIGRKKNLELLEVEIRKLEKADGDLHRRLEALKAQADHLRKADHSAAINELRRQLNQIQQEKAALQARIENIALFVGNFDKQAAESGALADRLEAEMLEIQEALQNKRTEADQLRVQLDQADGSFREVADLLGSASQAYNEAQIAFIRQQNKVNALRQELNFKTNRRQEIIQTQIAQTQTLKAHAQEKTQAEQELAELETWLQQAYQNKKAMESKLGEAEQIYVKARNEIMELENKSRENFRKQQELQLQVNRLKEQFTDVKFEITAIGERLRAEFGIEVNDIINREPNPELQRDALEKDVIALKRRLDNYGEINPMAIEAYNEIKARYDTIAGQRNDILGAKENLLQTMKEIEDTATQRFFEAFEKVRENFQRVFRTLFTEEDTADLLLTNPDAPLDSDIQIVAKPKGKRPQTIAQLSGGEKTLTATALLFALYLLKPAPFCIFDEVDAPLDDANIEKFNRIIRQFSADSQFVVVTHNKATMAAVDTIYGVYMPEPGVSAVTPVDFRQLNHEALVFEG